MVFSRHVRSFFIAQIIILVGCMNLLSAEPFQRQLNSACVLLERNVADEKVQQKVLVHDIKKMIDLVITETTRNPEFKQYGVRSAWSLKKRFFQPVVAVFVRVHARKLDVITVQDFLSKANDLVQAFSEKSSELALEEARWWQDELHKVAGVPLVKGKKAGFFDVEPHVSVPDIKNPDPIQKMLLDIVTECDTLKKKCLDLLGQYQASKQLDQDTQDKIDEYQELLTFYNTTIDQLAKELKDKIAQINDAEKQKIQAKIDKITKKIDAIGKSIADMLQEKV